MGKGKSPGRGGPYLLDRQLIPRIEQLAARTDITDIDEVVEQLRLTHKDYQRKQVAALRQMVTKAVQVVQQKGSARREAQLQAAEQAHLAKRRASSSTSKQEQQQESADGSSSSGDEEEEGGSSSSSSSSDADKDGDADSDSDSDAADDVNDPASSAAAAAAAAAAGAGSSGPRPNLNQSLLSMYGTSTPHQQQQQQEEGAVGDKAQRGKQTAPTPATTAAAQQQRRRSNSSGGGGPQRRKRRGSSSSSDGDGSSSGSEPDPNAPPAFAPAHVIAAAAARAAAAERAARAAKAAGNTPTAAAAAGGGAGVAASGPMSAAAADDQPGPSGRHHASSARVTPGYTAPPAAAAGAAAVGAADATPPTAAAAAGGGGGAPAAAAADGGGSGGGGDKRSRSAEEAELGRDSRCGAAAAGGGRAQQQEQREEQREQRPARAASKKQRRGGAGSGGGAPGGAGGGGGRKPGGGGSSAIAAPRGVTYADLGGIEEVLADIRELIEYPLKHPEVYSWLGVEPPRGVLLHGPPGCGKTALANAIANDAGVPFLRVAAPEVVSGMSGESEAKLRALFQEAQEVAPAIIFIDEIDAIAPKRETAQREMERRIVAQMLTCMDDLSAGGLTSGQTDAGRGVDQSNEGVDQPQQQQQQQGRRAGHVVVIGATNRPDSLDPALRRAGRFDREISLGIPTEAARAQILRVLTRPLRLQGDFDFRAIARRTPGFVGADLAALAKEAAAAAVTRIFKRLEAAADLAAADTAAAVAAEGGGAAGGAVAVAVPAAAAPPPGQSQSQRLGAGPLTAAELAGLAITMCDWEVALRKVQPSVRREGFTTKPDVTWEDVGSLEEVREELSFCIAQPITHPEAFTALGLTSAAGVLLYGPPGCGKTLVAKAAAAESGANFISIKGPELLNKYVGESERAVRQLFARARAAHPCVLFFDEMDALAPRRAGDASNQAAERLVNQLLTEMDGVEGRQGVYMVAATNRPDMIDPALLRPGRLDKILYVPLPPPEGRASILRAASRKTPLGPGVAEAAAALVAGPRCEGYSGADVAALVREAAVLALKEGLAARQQQLQQQQAGQQGSNIQSAAAAAAAAGPGGAGAGSTSAAAAAAGAAGASPTAAPSAAAGTSSTTSSHPAGVTTGTQGVPPSGPKPLVVELRHFEAALGRVSPSVSRRDQKLYDQMQRRLRAARGVISAEGPAAAAGTTAGGDEAPPTSLPGGLASAPPATAPAAAGQQQPAALPLPAAAAAAAGVGALPLAGVRSEAMGEGSEGGRGDDMEEEEPAAAGDPMADD